MQILKQSTATSVLIGPFLDDTDGKTPETGLTVASIDVDIYKGITKSDLTITASGGSNDMAHVANGIYSLELTTGNTNTLGNFRITANISGALPVWEDFIIYPSNVYDSLIAGTDNLQTALSGTSLNSVADSVWDEARSGHATSGTFGEYVNADLVSGAVDNIYDETIESSFTMRQIMRIIFAFAAGKSAGGGGSTVTFRDVADSKNRISATVDANGNRTAVGTRDGS